MPRIEEETKSKPLDALNHYECKVCGELLQWNLCESFNQDPDLDRPLNTIYTTMHCGLEYEVTIDTVKIRIIKPPGQIGKLKMLPKTINVNTNTKVKQQEKKKKKENSRVQMPAKDEPRAITMAKALKEKRKREKLAQNKNQAKEAEAVIEELESQGDLKEDVPVGGEGFKAEEPRQGP
jgi:primosomal protein N'